MQLRLLREVFSNANDVNLILMIFLRVSLHCKLVSIVIIHMKKLLDLDWLRAVQFKCNTPVQKVQITHRNSGSRLAERQRESFHVKQWQTFCTQTLKKRFLEWDKMAPRNIFRHFLRTNFFMFLLLISYHTVFLIQFEINLHLWVFKRFFKNSLVQINSKLNSKPYDYLYL